MRAGSNRRTNLFSNNAVFSAFGVSIDTEEFNNLMSVIKNTVIDISGLSAEKNNLDLVKWAEYAYENKWGYVYSFHCDVLTESEVNRLKGVFGSYVTEKEDRIRSHWLKIPYINYIEEAGTQILDLLF